MTNTNIMRLLGLTAILCAIPFANSAFAATATVTSAKVISPSQIQIVFSDPLDWAIGDFTDLNIAGEPRTVDSISEVAPSSTVTITFSGGSAVQTDATGDIDIAVIADGGSGNDFGGATNQAITDGQAAPVPVLSYSGTDPTNSNPVSFSVNFGEDINPATFTPSDVTASSGTVLNIADSGDGQNFTFDVDTPADGATLSVQITGDVDDLAGNTQSADSNTITADVDYTAPTVALTTGAPDPTNSAFSVTATFSEPVSGLLLSEISVTNGAASNLAGGPAVYTFDVTPTADGLVSISIPATSAQDAAGNDNLVSNTLSRTYDTTLSATVSIASSGNPGYAKNGDTVTITIISSDTLHITAQTIDGKAAIPSVDGTTVTVTRTMDGTETEGVLGFSVTVEDTALNTVTVIATTDATQVIADFTAPSAPTTPDLQAASDNGGSDTDDITSDTTPTFDIVGTTPGDTIILYEGVNQIGTGAAGSAITSSVLGDGTYSITATATDPAGNVSASSGALSITIDTAGSPTILILGDNPVHLDWGTTYSDAGATASDGLDGDLTGSIVTSGAVIDTTVEGGFHQELTYTVQYDVVDSNGNPATATREVTVGYRPAQGDYCTGDCIPPTIGLDSSGRRMVDWPVIYHTSTVDFRQLAEYFHTPMNDFTVNVGDINTLQFVVYDNSGFDAIRQIGLSIGVPFSGTFNDGAAQLRWFAAPLGQTVGENTSYMEETDKDNVFELKSFDTERVECDPHKTGNNNCMGVTVKYIFREAPKDTAVRLDIWDEKRNAFQHVLNEGVTVKGDSMNGPDVFTAMGNDGYMYTLTTNNDFATDQNGDRWSLVDGFWSKDLKPVINSLDDAREMAKDKQESIAKQTFDGSKIQKTITPVKDFIPEHYDRLHDPVPNMIKAYIDYAKSKAGHS